VIGCFSGLPSESKEKSMANIEGRLLAAEAELLVMRRYMRALISLLPESPEITEVFADTQRTLNFDANAVDNEIGMAIAKATSEFGWRHAPFRGLLSGTKIGNG
jgi:hypothetical protein